MDNEKRITILINPQSGYGKGHKVFKQLLKLKRKDPLLSKHIQHLQFTSVEKEQEKFSRIIEDSEIILICGGDGTIHRYINLLATHSTDKILSIFPLGTGNDLYSHLGAKEKHIIRFIYKIIQQPQVIDIDLFALNNSVYFMNYLSFGIEAYIISLYEHICNWLKKFFLFRFRIFHIGYLKKLLLFLIGLGALVFYKKKIVVSRQLAAIDNHPKNQFTSIIIHNIKSYAGGSILNHDSSLNDGKLEFAFNASNIDFFKMILNRFGLFNFKLFSKTQAPPFHFSIDTPVCLQVDGEDYTDTFKDTQNFTIDFKKRLRLYY